MEGDDHHLYLLASQSLWNRDKFLMEGDDHHLYLLASQSLWNRDKFLMV